MAERPPIQQSEQISTPEKSAEELYLDALEKKRDTLLAFHTMTAFRKGKSPEDMTPEQVEKYKVLREDWRSKKESSMGSWDSLSEDKQQELAAMGSRLFDVHAKLTLLKKAKETPGSEKAEVVAPEVSDQGGQEMPVSETQEPSGQPTTEKPESALTLEEAERKLEQEMGAKHQLGAAYWEAKVAELQERQKAEMDAKRREDLRNKLKELESTLSEKYRILHQEVREIDRRSLEEEIRNLEEEKARLEKELEASEGKVGKSWGDRIRSVFGRRKAEVVEAEETEKTEPKPEGSKQWTTLGWLAERGKGILSAGIWEVRQAWRFQQGTKLAASDAEAISALIHVENADEAQGKANEILQIMKENNITTATAPEFLDIAKKVTYEKAAENNDRIDHIIKTSIETLKERVAKYRGQATAETVLTPENLKAVEDELRMQLNKFRDGVTMKDVKNFAKVMRDNMDKRWWLRYIYAPLEASLLGYLSYHYLPWSRWLGGGGEDLIPGATDVNLSTEDFGQRYMDHNMWEESREQLKELGVENPTNTEIQAVDSAAAQENNIKVVNPENNQTLWPGTEGGQTKDISMMKGLIKWGAAHKAAFAIKAARIAAGI